MSQNPNKPFDQRKISRIDLYKNEKRIRESHGWEVRFQSVDKSKEINQFFSDKKYGGKNEALKIAKSFRDAIEYEKKVEITLSHLNVKMKSRNKSGFVGVHRTKHTDKKKYNTYVYDVWQAHFPISRNKQRSKRFSITKYGEVEALRLALEARKEGLKKYNLLIEKEYNEKEKTSSLFIPPSNPEIKIWRYMDFTKFVSLLDNGGIFFPVAQNFNDQFEGSFSILNKKLRPLIYKHLNKKYSAEQISEFYKKFRKWICISCWHMNESESAGMWSLYSKIKESICIQSTFKRFRSSFNKEIKIGMVRYLDYNKEWIPEDNILAPFLYKRKSFEHERELRAIYNLSNVKDFNELEIKNKRIGDGKWIDVDLDKFIEKIFISPNSPNWFLEIVKNIVHLYNLNIPVLRSSLEEEPFY